MDEDVAQYDALQKCLDNDKLKYASQQLVAEDYFKWGWKAAIEFMKGKHE